MAALISGLTGIEVKLKEPWPVSPRLKKDLAFGETKKVIKEIKKNLKNYWQCFS